MNEEPIVFISYTHDSIEHKSRVLRLVDKLRDEGVDCHIDQYETSPPGGWARWMVNQVKNSNYVIVVCTEIYERRFEGNEMVGKGLGAQWEGLVITQELYESAAHNTKFIPVVFSAEDSRFIPIILKGATFYRIEIEEGYEDLYRRLTAQPRIAKPPLGKKRVLPTRNFQSQPQNAQPLTAQESSIESLPASQSKKTAQNLFLIYLDENSRQFIPAAQVTIEEKIEVRLRPENPRQKAFLADLTRSHNRNEFAAAYKDNAWLVRLEKSVQSYDAAEEWKLILEPHEDNRSSAFISEMSFNGYTGDDFAELRARRILLNEQIEKRDLWNRGSLQFGMLEHAVRRGSGFIEEIYSPIPVLYDEIGNNAPRFLEAARLMCVLFLQLNRVVKHIYNLEISMSNSDGIGVEFEGERAKQYVNQEPRVIKFSGICRVKSD